MKKRPEKKHLFRHLILTTNCKICIYYVFERMLWNFGTLSCSTVTTYLQQIRCACSMKVASSPSTFREQNECFANTIFFPQQQGETFAFEVSTLPCLNSDRGYTVSPALLCLLSHEQCGQVTQCNHKLSRKRQRDVAETSREKVSWDFTLFLRNRFFLFLQKMSGKQPLN